MMFLSCIVPSFLPLGSLLDYSVVKVLQKSSNVFGDLEQIDQLIEARCDKVEILNKILQLLRKVVPYHQAGILVSDGTEMSFVAHNGTAWLRIERLEFYRAPPTLSS